jgi:hypothetical protein
MILTAHQPVYLPWLGLFHKIAMAETFVSFNRVQYLPKDWNNRNKIKTSSGNIWLTVPVLKSGHREKGIDEIEINNAIPWQRKHWRSISLNYSQAPFFAEYAPYLEGVYEKEWKYLSELNESMLQWFLDALGINVQFLKASGLDFKGTGSELVLNMCEQLGADTYIFGALGRDYAKVEEFESRGIAVEFQDYNHPEYPQRFGSFASHLSVLDLLFNCGPESLNVLMSGQEQLV